MSISQELEELAKTGYHAYGEFTDFKNYQGLPMPAWEDLPGKIQGAWLAAAEAMFRQGIEKLSGSLAKTIIDDIAESFEK